MKATCYTLNGKDKGQLSVRKQRMIKHWGKGGKIQRILKIGVGCSWANNFIVRPFRSGERASSPQLTGGKVGPIAGLGVAVKILIPENKPRTRKFTERSIPN
jgi:hypothetical protein